MKTTKLTLKEAINFISDKNLSYPKYCAQIINLANQNGQGTRPKVVGQMSDLIQEFEGSSLQDWRKWYLEGHPTQIDTATDKIYAMVKKIQEAHKNIDREMIRTWVEDLVIDKTYVGLKCQEAIIMKIANIKNLEWRLATPDEEAKGIDGYIGDIAVSVKAKSYDSKAGLSETIEASMIYYEKKKSSFKIEYDF